MISQDVDGNRKIPYLQLGIFAGEMFLNEAVIQVSVPPQAFSPP